MSLDVPKGGTAVKDAFAKVPSFTVEGIYECCGRRSVRSALKYVQNELFTSAKYGPDGRSLYVYCRSFRSASTRRILRVTWAGGQHGGWFCTCKAG